MQAGQTYTTWFQELKHLLQDNKKAKLTITVLLIILQTAPIFGQNNQTDKHPIDIKREQCHEIDSNQTTYGMMQCETVAREEWDKEMNKYYKLLMDTLTIEEKEKLKIAQRQWLDFRDRELDFSGTMYYNMQGTMWRVVAAGRSCDIVKERALELKGYYDMLTFDGEER
jgi:uncharacterized protein YecT (DUF1311 family)